jgi:hypothetical protein
MTGYRRGCRQISNNRAIRGRAKSRQVTMTAVGGMSAVGIMGAASQSLRPGRRRQDELMSDINATCEAKKTFKITHAGSMA